VQAATVEEAVDLLKKKWGKDVAVIDVKYGRRFLFFGKRYVEVVAAVEEVPHKSSTDSEILQELQQQRAMLARLMAQLEGASEDRLSKAYRLILEMGFSPEFASELLSSAPMGIADDLNALYEHVKKYLKKRIKTKPLDAYDTPYLPHVVVLLGPTGVGKTTTIAKIASILAINKRRRVALFSIDTFRLGAIEQLQEYASILRVPFEVIRNPEEIAPRLVKYSDFDYVLVDTIGRSPNDGVEILRLSSFISAFPSGTHLLTVSANTDPLTLRAIRTKFSKHIKFHGVIATKLDEAVTTAPIMEFLVTSGLPLVYMTTGQRVPNDIMGPSVEYLLERLGRSDS